ncbi:LysE family translocator [Parahaliea sp. F7430]|uniref:LysE family translocator n=1 Tax=Sediminihaliea albiluteola TaxID=2758564 RepID=A0A7W2TU17_9GAMM|nr:LysE family translocator [Sediminihaliea albiluteola]MBA6411969.1 LysE family translocator [Sediminihaliea albiluteola]
MEFSQWLSLLSICLLGAISPGPSLAVVMSNAMQLGFRAGLHCAIAHGSAVALYALLTVTGLALLISQSPSLFSAIQISGAAYLIWLGIKALRKAPKGSNTGAQPLVGSGPISSGFLVAFLNPKLAIFMLALFSQFLGPELTVTMKVIMVATVGITDGSWYCLVAALVSRRSMLKHILAKPRLIDALFATVLIALGASVLWRALGPFFTWA